MDDELISNESSSMTSDLSLVTQMRNENDRTSQFDIDQTNLSTILPNMIASSDATYEGQTGLASISSDHWSFSSFSPTSDLDFMTSSERTKIIIEEQWFNVNQSHRRDPYRSVLFWKRTNGNGIFLMFLLTFVNLSMSCIDPSWNGATYILKSEPRCIRQMCSIVLKYNGTLSTRISGCLSFTLRIRGQPGKNKR